jgi:protein-export SecD/SecF family membrane protein
VYDEAAHAWVPEGAVSGRYLTQVFQSVDPERFRPAVSFGFSGEGAMEFGDLTRANVGRLLAIVLDDDVMQVATIRSQITSSGQLTGDFSDDDVKGIVTILRGGSLPTRPILISESTVGSVLGQDSIRSGMQAILIGLSGVLLIMAGYYLVGGLVADFALCLNLLLILAFVACFRQTLTLPGIAGMLLTLAMAVDANILIFERYREERRKGKPFSQAPGASYNRAFSVIFDSNVTTLISAYVLFYMGTGPVKGFAVTLITGIFASFFTAVFVTRLVLSMLGRLGVIKDIKMLEAFETPRVPFTRYRRPFIVGSVVVIALTWVLVIWRGKENYGIEFTGGARVTMNLSRPVKVEDLRSKISDLSRDRPDLFRDWTLQTLQASGEGTGVSRRYALLTRAGAGGNQAEAQEAIPPAGSETKAPADSAKAKPAETPPVDPKTEQGGVGSPPAAPPVATAATQAATHLDAAQQVRQVLEGMLDREGWLVPPAFPRTEWEPVPGAGTGSERLVLEVNVLAEKDKEPLTVDDLKGRLNAVLEANPLFTTAGRDPAPPTGRADRIRGCPRDGDARRCEPREAVLDQVTPSAPRPAGGRPWFRASRSSMRPGSSSPSRKENQLQLSEPRRGGNGRPPVASSLRPMPWSPSSSRSSASPFTCRFGSSSSTASRSSPSSMTSWWPSASRC